MEARKKTDGKTRNKTSKKTGGKAGNKKRGIRIFGWLLLVLILLVPAALIGPRWYAERKKNVTRASVLYVHPDGTYRDLLDSLSLRLADPASFASTARHHELETGYKPGRYALRPGMTNLELVRMLRLGWQTPMNLTLSGNIRTVEKLAGILGRKLAADSLDFLACFRDPLTWQACGLTRETFPSLFIPNTYEVYWTLTPQQFIERMKKEHDRFWTPERTEKARALGLSREEVSTLASIVCEESQYSPERSAIAGVYLNRLKKGMKLEADPTVKFALNDPGIRRILFRHLQTDSPYNTYLHPGLPPGPITIPDTDGLEAVLNPAAHSYLYFCASDKLDGTHRFAATLQEHNRNAAAYHRAISRR